MSESSSDPEAGPPVVQYTENGLLILRNPLITVGLSAADGTVVSLVQSETGTDVIASGATASEGHLWRLMFTTAAGDEVEATNRECVEFSHDLARHRHEGALRLWLQWRGLRLGGEVIAGVLTAHITLPENGSSALFEMEIELPDGHVVRSLEFPCLAGVRHPDAAVDDALFLPLSGGVLLPDPRSLSPPGQPKTWQVGYPGPASLQMFGYVMGDRTALWLAAQDPSGARKAFSASAMASTDALVLSVTHYPWLRPEGYWTVGYPTAVGLVNGDWFEVAREYRAWATEQPWAARGRGGERVLPPLTTAYGLWASFWGGARRCVSPVTELQRIVNVPIKLDWRCWHACTRGGAYPDYLPPRDGDAAWAAAEQQLGDAGVLDQVSVSALLASSKSMAWQEHDLAPHSLRLDGDPAPLARPVDAPLSVMCPGTDHWRQTLAAVAREVAARGADGVLLEDLGSATASTCHSPNHGHRTTSAGEWTDGVRALLHAIREAVGSARQIAVDEMSEAYLGDVDAFMSPHAAAERQFALTEEFGQRWTPIPLFASVYHDYATVVGPASSLVNQRPHDPAWSAPAISELREPAPVMQRDYQTQFCLEIARSMVWGYQPLLEDFRPEQARDETNRRKLAFLAAALRAQAWGIGALLPQSQFMGPISIECPRIEADLLVNPPGSIAAERHSVRRTLPSVMGSAWRVPGGGLALVIVNIGSQPADFAARLRSSRLSLQLPLRLMGRTFSEDGDVPAASLGSSGSEITGKLPGRAIVLVSLR